jgi:hypothetical protein
MSRLRQWFAKAITSLNCLVNGHAGVSILTRYPDQTRVKITGTLGDEKNKAKITGRQVTRVKARCRRCGKVFLDYAGDEW